MKRSNESQSEGQSEKKLTPSPPSEPTLDEALQKCCNSLKAGADSATELGAVVEKFGVEAMRKWRFQAGKHSNPLLHSLVAQKLGAGVEYLVKQHGFDINLPRASDLCTPLHLSIWMKNSSLSALLLDLGADPLKVNSYGENCSKLLETIKEWKAKCENIVWLDFELDALPIDALATGTKPRVMECCIMITNNDLDVIEEKSWIIHFSEEELKVLSPWHQKNFAPEEEGGNGLIEACLKAELSAEQFGEELLEFVQKNCAEKISMLAGNSVHVDQQVLVLAYPKVARFLSHRVLDVSVLNTIASRWFPTTLKGLDACYKTYNHRARGDVLSSMAQLKFYKAALLQQAKGHVEEKASNAQGVDAQAPASEPALMLATLGGDLVQEPGSEVL